MSRALRLLFLLLVPGVVACRGQRLKHTIDECPTGCWTSLDECVEGTAQEACGTLSSNCLDCGALACVDQVCQAPVVVPDAGVLPQGDLLLSPPFEVVGSAALPEGVSRVAALQSQDWQPDPNPELFGLKPASREVVSLGRWPDVAQGAVVTSAVAPADLSVGVTFSDAFIADREVLLTHYRLGGELGRFHLWSKTRKLGSPNVDTRGEVRIGAFGDFFILQAAGLDALAGNGVYVFLDGPAINGQKRVASTQDKNARAGVVSWATRDVAVLGVVEPNSNLQKVYACSFDALVSVFQNLKSPFTVDACVKIHEQVSILAAAPVGTGVAFLSRTPEGQQRIDAVKLDVQGPYNKLTINPATAVPLLAEVAGGSTTVEFVLQYDTHLLVAVKDSGGRRLLRIRWG